MTYGLDDSSVPRSADRRQRAPSFAEPAMVVKIHERVIPAPAPTVGRLIDRMGSPDDRLWPRSRWPSIPVWFEPRLQVGAAGGHGPLRYTVESYEPGRQVLFRIHKPKGLVGTHGFEVERLSPDRSLLRHTLRCNLRGAARVYWPLVLRPLHDALVGDLLDQAEASLGSPRAPRAWSPWVRLLRWLGRRRMRSRAGGHTQPPANGNSLR